MEKLKNRSKEIKFDGWSSDVRILDKYRGWDDIWNREEDIKVLGWLPVQLVWSDLTMSGYEKQRKMEVLQTYAG